MKNLLNRKKYIKCIENLWRKKNRAEKNYSALKWTKLVVEFVDTKNEINKVCNFFLLSLLRARVHNKNQTVDNVY